MMTIGNIAAGGWSYYTSKDNYYFLGNLEARWAGEGAKTLGLTGTIDRKAFEEILAGRLPDGQSLERKEQGVNTHRPGYDLTFSAPKSVSVLGLVGGDGRMVDAHNRAVDVAVKEIESLVSTRLMENGVSDIRLTGNLVAALFNHDTSRELDPQLHTHVLAMNVTLLDGVARTLSSDTKNKGGFIEAMYAMHVSLGKIYRHTLREEVEAMGFETVAVGKNDLWEIRGVPTEIFSQRSRQIHEAVGKEASFESRNIAALDTRKGKQSVDRLSLLSEWTERLHQQGFTVAEFVSAAVQRQTSIAVQTPPSLDGVNEVNPVKEAIRGAISLLSDKQPRFTYSELLHTSVNRLNAEPGVIAEVRQAIDTVLQEGHIIPLDNKKGTFTSAIHLLDELSVQQLATRMQQENRTRVFAVPAHRPEGIMAKLADTLPALAILDNRGGAARQREQVEAAVSLVQGQGRRVAVMAPDRAIEQTLRQSEGLRAQVIDRDSLLRPGETSVLLPESTLVVPNAEKLSVKETLTLLDQAQRQHVQVLLLDSAGRQGTGNAMAVLEEAGVVRFSAEKNAAVEVAVVSEADKRMRYTALAERYGALTSQAVPVLAQVSGVREQAALTEAIRHRLQTDGVLGEKAVTLAALQPIWLDSKSRKQMDTYREGMVMERWDEKTRQRERYTVDRVTAQSRTLTLMSAQGDAQVMRLSELDSSWSLYQPGTLAVAEGETLTLLARQGKLSARDNVTVKAINARELVVEKDGKSHRLPLQEGIKATYGYVTSPGSRVQETATVLAAVAGRDTHAQMLNTLAGGGQRIELFTPLSQEEAHRRLSRSPWYRPVKDQIDPEGKSLAQAMEAARDTLMPTAEKAVRQGIDITQGSHVMFRQLELKANTLPLSPGLTPAAIDAEFMRLVTRGEVLAVPGSQGQAQQQYVTAVSWENEKTILRLIVEGKGTQTPLMTGADSSLFAGLTEGQQTSSRLILENTDRFIGIQGYAGVGKTTQFKAVLAALGTLLERERPEVVGLAPTHRAVGEMSEVGVKAQTVAAFLMEMERQRQNGQTVDFRHTLFLVDEGSMLGNRSTAEAMRYIAEGGGRAVLSGDKDQLLSVDNGAPFSLMQQRSALDVAIMQDIVRQSPALRPAMYAIIERDMPEALAVIRSVSPEQVPRLAGAFVPESSVMAPTKQQTDEGLTVTAAVIRDYLGRPPSIQAETLIVTQTNADRQTVNEGIHAGLKAQGAITGGVTVPVLERVKTQAEKLLSVSGMVEQSGRIALINQRYYTIQSTTDSRQDGVVMLIDEAGKAHHFAAFESSLRDIAIYERTSIDVSVGEKVRFDRTDRERGRTTQDTWTVSAIKEGTLILSRGDEQRELRPDAELADQHLGYGYAGTAHKAQGASARFGIALAGVEGGRKFLASHRDAYVAFSRTREHVQVYVDNMEKWLDQVSRQSERLTAHDLLETENDRMAKAAQGVWARAQPINHHALGRALTESGALMAGGEARFVSGSQKYPVPHVATPAYDENGRQQGVYLQEIQLSAEGRLDGVSPQGRLLGSEKANHIVLRRSEDGMTQIADTLAAANQAASQFPSNGIVLRLDKGSDINPVILATISGGMAETLPLATTENTTLPEPQSIKTPEEKAQEQAEREAMRALQNEWEDRLPLRDTDSERDEREQIQQLTQEKTQEQDKAQTLWEKAAELEQAHRRNQVRENLRQMEHELVKEKTLGE